MSGGAFDYRDNALFDVRDMVAREIGYLEYGGESWTEPTKAKTLYYMKNICHDLSKLGQALHALDWYLSGDTCEETFIEKYEELYNK